MLDPDRPDLRELRSRISRVRPRQRTLLLGVDGRGGSGKSTLARWLAADIGNATVVEFDDFYRPSEERARRRERGESEIGGDFDWRRVRDEVLEPLAGDRPARYRRYDWLEDRLAETHEIAPGGVVIVEGNYSTRPELRGYYDLTVWVEAPHAARLRRGVERDGEAARRRWLEEWMPEEDRYLAAYAPQSQVDVVVDGGE